MNPLVTLYNDMVVRNYDFVVHVIIAVDNLMSLLPGEN